MKEYNQINCEIGWRVKEKLMKRDMYIIEQEAKLTLNNLTGQGLTLDHKIRNKLKELYEPIIYNKRQVR